ncbi:MAG: DUF3592 domain-containing protein [Verrucomicrobiota bacterium]
MKSKSPPPRWMRPFFGIVLLLCGLGCIASLAYKEGRLLASGQRTEGVVEKVIERHSSSTTTNSYDMAKGRYVRKGGGVTYDMMMRFTTAGGQSVLTQISAMFGAKPAVGDRHAILYLPANPMVAKVETFRQLWLPMCVGLTVTTLLLGGSGWLLRGRKN